MEPNCTSKDTAVDAAVTRILEVYHDTKRTSVG